MGQICCPRAQQAIIKEVETEKEISIASYSSKCDKDFIKLEQNFNLLRDISLSDYLMALSKFNMNNATVPEEYVNTKSLTYSKDEPYFNEPLSADLFQSFIENKLLKHSQVYTKAGNNEILSNIFKANLLNIQKGLITKLEAWRKSNGLEPEPEPFRKCHAMAIGLLYCNASNVYRIKFLFNLLADNGVLNKSDTLINFLMALFLIPSYCQLFSRNKLGTSYTEVGEYTKEKMKEQLNACELKDSVNLVDVLTKELFPTEGGIRYEQFKSLFERREESIGWVLSSKGIRAYLEKNNV